MPLASSGLWSRLTSFASVNKAERDAEAAREDDVLQDVTLRIEFMTSREITFAWVVGMAFSFVLVWASVALTIAQFKGISTSWSHGRYFRACTIISCVFLALSLAQGGHMAYRIWLTRKRKMTWVGRRKRLVAWASALLIVEILALVFWTASSAYQVASTCHWMATPSNVLGYLQWTMIYLALFIFVCGAHDICVYRPSRAEKRRGVNSDPHLLVMDASWRVHLPKGLLWLAGQIVLSFLFWRIFERMNERKRDSGWNLSCSFYSHKCTMANGSVVFFVLMFVVVVVYFLFYIFYLYRANRDLRSRAYSETRVTRTLWYFQTRETLAVYLVLVIGLCLLMLPRLGTCWAYILCWLGPIPAHAAVVECCLILSYAYMPKNRDHKGEILQVWLQEFAWTEAGKPAALAARNHHLANSAELAMQPMMCMETAIKLLYWTSLIYDIDEVEGTPFLLDYAKSLYDLDRHEMLWDELTDTKSIIAWGKTNVVVAFAGTKSMANIRTDLKAITTIHLPKRRAKGWKGRWGGHLRVHKGFYTAYCANEYNTRLLARLQRIRSESRDPGSLHFYFTGHSLGGALTTLAACELIQSVPDAQITVYTYGAPRVGTRRWSQEYASLIRDHFAVICDQDPVPRVPKGFGYKRVGERIVIDRAGNLMVRPSPLEKVMWNCNGGYVTDHLLSQYRASLAAIIKSQFGSAALQGGLAGAQDLARALDLDAALVIVNCDVDSLRDPKSRPILQEIAARIGSRPVLSQLRLPTDVRSWLCGLTCAPPGSALPQTAPSCPDLSLDQDETVRKLPTSVDGTPDVPVNKDELEVAGAAPSNSLQLANEAGTAVIVEEGFAKNNGVLDAPHVVSLAAQQRPLRETQAKPL